MEKLNSFFLKLSKSPGLLWKLGASMIFIVFAGAIFFVPSLSVGLSDSTRATFAGILLAYGIFRLVTFYFAYKSSDDE